MAAGILVKASVMGYFNQDSFFCSTNCLSKSSMEIESDRVLAMGDVIQCSLFMPGKGRVRADAEVSEISKRKGGTSRYVLKFLRITPEHEDTFEGALAGPDALAEAAA